MRPSERCRVKGQELIVELALVEEALRGAVRPGDPCADRRDEALHERGTAIVEELRQRSTSRPAPGEQPPAGTLIVLRPSGAEEAVAADPHAGRVSDGPEGEDGGQGLVRTLRVAQDRVERRPGGGPDPDRVERATH